MVQAIQISGPWDFSIGIVIMASMIDLMCGSGNKRTFVGPKPLKAPRLQDLLLMGFPTTRPLFILTPQGSS